jgi:hypothetical protein
MMEYTKHHHVGPHTFAIFVYTGIVVLYRVGGIGAV